MKTLPLVLLPGMMCDARLFGPQIADLSRTNPIHLGALSGHSTIAELADEVLAHAPPKFALAGISMGGIVAMEIYARAPERVQRMALMDTNPGTDTDEMRANRDCQMTKAKNGDLETIMRRDMIPNYLSESSTKDQIQALCLEMALDMGKDVFIRQSIALRNRPDQRETLRLVSIPTLVLCGEDDQLCPIQKHNEIHSLIVGSEIVVIKSAGHLPILEQPETTTAALRRWMEE